MTSCSVETLVNLDVAHKENRLSSLSKTVLCGFAAKLYFLYRQGFRQFVILLIPSKSSERSLPNILLYFLQHEVTLPKAQRARELIAFAAVACYN